MNRLLWLFAIMGCAPSLAPDSSGETDDDVAAEEDEVALSPYDNTIDASVHDAWIYLDLETLQVVNPVTPEDSTEWDIAFQRMAGAANSGISGSADVQVAMVEGAYDDFHAPPVVPQTGWTVDEPDDDDENDKPEYSFDGWFDYNPSNHVLTPHDALFYVRTVEGNVFVWRFLDYYVNGSPGYISFEAELVEWAQTDTDDSDTDF